MNFKIFLSIICIFLASSCKLNNSNVLIENKTIDINKLMVLSSNKSILKFYNVYYCMYKKKPITILIDKNKIDSINLLNPNFKKIEIKKINVVPNQISIQLYQNDYIIDGDFLFNSKIPVYELIKAIELMD